MTREEAVARIKDHIEIHRYHERNAVKIFEALDMAIKSLEQPEQQWIPCSEGLPKEGMRIIVQYDDGSLEIIEHVRLKIWNLISSPYAKVVAWMPSPEPWKG